jgi:RimJ/RimL family protein N-acetyltransferase
MPMEERRLLVRESTIVDFESVVDYFLNADEDFLNRMGVDVFKLPKRDEWLKLLVGEYSRPIQEKNFYYLIWLLNDIPVGHSNINKIVFGEEAYMHLHMWSLDSRMKGLGAEFVKLCTPHYFNKFRLRRLYCEPNAMNPAPNRTLEKLRFEFIKQYATTPGWINYYQNVNLWCLRDEKNVL